MGGVDLADAKHKTYSCSRQAKKCWHRLFYFLIDIAIVNVHVLMLETPNVETLSQKFNWQPNLCHFTHGLSWQTYAVSCL